MEERQKKYAGLVRKPTKASSSSRKAPQQEKKRYHAYHATWATLDLIEVEQGDETINPPTTIGRTVTKTSREKNNLANFVSKPMNGDVDSAQHGRITVQSANNRITSKEAPSAKNKT